MGSDVVGILEVSEMVDDFEIGDEESEMGPWLPEGSQDPRALAHCLIAMPMCGER